MKRKWIEVVFVAALFAAALAFVACKNIEDGGEIQQPPAPEQGASGGSQGEGQPGGGDNTGNEGENPDEGGDEGDEQNPPQPSGKTVVELLKEIIGENEYDAISAEVAAGNMTLTEEKIKAVGDIFPALEKDAESGKEAKDVENAEIIRQNKEAFIAQNEGKINITKSGIYTLNSYNVLVTFNGEFDLDKISLPANNGKGNFSNATLKNSVYDISIDEFNDIRGSSLPTISSTNISSNSSPKAIYNLYKAYSSNLDKLTLNGDLTDTNINGKEISGKSDYTLFANDNKAKLSTDTSIISLSADALAQMTNQLKIENIYNMIISGNANANKVNWRLVNIVFEKDMSKLENKLSSTLYGIVYFKDKPYNNNAGNAVQGLYGMLKLDKVKDIDSENFRIGFGGNICVYNVLDVRGVDKSELDAYNPTGREININGGDLHAIYFNEYYDSYKGNEIEIDKLCRKFSSRSKSGALKVYLGDNRENGNFYNSSNNKYFAAASKTPRTLKEFEYFGNETIKSGIGKFEKSAYSSYSPTEFNNLPQEEQTQLNNDDGKNEIAQNNRKSFSCQAKSFV